MSFLTKRSVADLVEFIITQAAHQQSAAVNTAKGIIALVDVTGSEANARAELKKAKVSDCTVKNAMQLVWAYDAVVRPGHTDEKWFDALLYAHAVEVRRAIAKVGIVKVCEAKLFAKSAKTNLIEFELLADTGLTREERIVADQAKTDADLVAAQAAKKKDATESTPAAAPKPAAEAPAPGAVAALETAKNGKPKKGALAEFDVLIGSAEKFIGAVIPTADDLTVETMKNRVTALMVVLDTAVKARGTASRTTAAA